VYFAFGKLLNSQPKTKNSQLVSALLDWFTANARDLPWRRTRDPYAIWISEIMLQQTQVKTVIPFWNRWMSELPTIEAAAQAPSAKIHKLWEGLGYYTRVRNLQKAAQVIVEKHGGTFPGQFEAILALPGIGRYTAGAISSIAFNQPTPILDGNVIRVLTRIFGIGENPKEKETNARLWQLAEDLVKCAAGSARVARAVEGVAPSTSDLARRQIQHAGSACSHFQSENSCSHLNQSLMELGALICTPRNAQCLICPVRKLCVAFKAGCVDEWPNLVKRETATARHFLAFTVECSGKFLVQQRPAGVVNAHLWEFPNVETTGTKPDAEAAFHKLFGVKPKTVQPLRTVKHSITRYRITLDAFSILLAKRPVNTSGRWLAPAEFDSLAFSSAHKKLATAATKSMLSGQ